MKMRKGKQAIPAKPKKVTLDNFKIVNDYQNDNRSEFGYENENLNLYTDSNSPNNCSSGSIEVKGNITNSKKSQLHDNVSCAQAIQKNTQAYYSLQKFDPNQHIRIIRGDFHQGDERFNELSRGKQCMAVSIVALCFFKINNSPAAWTTADINNILINGDIQYHASYKKMKREGKTPEAKHLLISNVYPYIKFGRQYFSLNGAKNVFDCLDVENDVFNLTNFERSLNRFFNENQNECGAFTCNDYSFAIMRKSNSFFLFNPYAASYAGELMNPNDEESAACLMEMFTVRCLANYLLETCSHEQRRFDDSECDTFICYSLTKINIEKEVFGKDILKRRKVNRDLYKAESNKGGVKRKHKPELFGNSEEHINSRLKRDHLEKHTLLNEAKMQNQDYFLEKATSDRVNQDGDNNNSINIDYEFANVSINEHDATEVLIGCGMLNLGNSCFFNACFQSFFHIPTINILLQKIRTKKCTCVVCNMITVFKDTHNRKYQQQYYNPSNLYRALQKGNEDLLNGDQQDAHEFWMRLMNMENEGTCSAMFDRLFAHEVVTIVKCGICGTNSETKRVFTGHVIEVRGLLTIREAVDSYFAEQIVETYKCSFCKHINIDAKKKHILQTAPNILCLMLNRFENNDKKIEDNIVLNEQLKLSVSSETTLINYKLVSLINHFGTNLFKGHYTAVACHSSHSFSEFDDSRVRNVNAVIGSNAYIILYELTETEIEDTYNSESNHAVQWQHDEQNFFIENESVSSNLYEESENRNDTHAECQEVQNESENHGEENKIPSGRRIVDIGFLFEQMKYLNQHSVKCDSQMLFRKETKLGFRSIFHFECSNCGIFHQIQSSSKNDDYLNINKAATLGFTSIGSGFYHLEEVCAHLNIPCMSSSTFDEENKKLQKDWYELSKHHTEKALLEEIKLAKARGDVDSAGNALIQVTCDGSWGKRSYGKGYSSLSGCAVIIGVRSKKVLYFGVKNKYCHVCTLSYAKFCPPNDHVCNINYVGPSSGMETEILVEGFQFCKLMGARFDKVICDGDSSAFKEITERCIYEEPDLVIEKLECKNHLYKNARKKFTDLCRDTKFKLGYRKLLKDSIGDDLCKGIRSAAKHWRESNLDLSQKLENLERDCLNIPYHYFGNHNKCDQYFCKKTTTKESYANINLLKSCGLFHEIMSYCNSYFASNVRSLIEDETTNPAEELNNVIAKYLGGKRINYSLAGSYTARVSAAVVQYNSEGHAGSQFHNFHSINTNNYCAKIENFRKEHYAKNEVARQTKPRKKATRDKSVKGYKAQKEDLSERALEVAMNIELAKLDANRINREVILKSTLNQKHNLKWMEIRKKLVNSNYFGRIINAKSKKSYQKLLGEMLKSPVEFGKTAEVRHQRLYEPDALSVFSKIHKDYKLEKTGIFIDEKLSFLGASPLRLYGPDSIVNVQCPLKAFRSTVDDAIVKNWLPFSYEDGDVAIKERSNWYIEVQGQLHITGRKICYLVVWLGAEFIIKKVVVDHSFWNIKMEKKLEFFFKEAMLKELANSRRARKMDLRKYDPQTDQFV